MSKVHLSYEDFKATYGDLGLTYWIKFNYLSMDYVGKYNVWDGQWENGYIGDGGSLYDKSDSIRSKNYNVCYSGATYYSAYTANTVYIHFYDEEKNWIQRDAINATEVVAPEGACYFKISCYSYGSTYNNDIRIYQPVLEE